MIGHIIRSEDAVLSSSFVRNIYFKTVSDIVIGPESSDVLMPQALVSSGGLWTRISRDTIMSCRKSCPLPTSV